MHPFFFIFFFPRPFSLVEFANAPSQRKVGTHPIRLMPCKSTESARSWLAASEGCTPSQNTYWVALLQLRDDLERHKNTVFPTVPVLQQLLVASLKPVKKNNAKIESWKWRLIQVFSAETLKVEYHNLKEIWQRRRGAWKCRRQLIWGLEAASEAGLRWSWAFDWILGHQCWDEQRIHSGGWIQIKFWLLGGNPVAVVKSLQFSWLLTHTIPVFSTRTTLDLTSHYFVFFGQKVKIASRAITLTKLESMPTR